MEEGGLARAGLAGEEDVLVRVANIIGGELKLGIGDVLHAVDS